ncbi:MAG: helix-hairpin-helix domain-containing protein [Planctomyces sp.]|nr:helix-hairpin-helix domain-containing protein [Planctomyces sp.]
MSGSPDSGSPEGDAEGSTLGMLTARFGWSRTDCWFFGVLAAVGLAALCVHLARLSGWGLRAVAVDRPEARRYEYQVDINSATWVEWMQLDGIGEALARRIVEDREANGVFASIEDVARVRGIGPATLDRIRPHLRRSEPPDGG